MYKGTFKKKYLKLNYLKLPKTKLYKSLIIVYKHLGPEPNNTSNRSIAISLTAADYENLHII